MHHRRPPVARWARASQLADKEFQDGERVPAASKDAWIPPSPIVSRMQGADVAILVSRARLLVRFRTLHQFVSHLRWTSNFM